MNTVTTLNRHQKRYLRALRDGGDRKTKWPRLEVVQRWMQQESFRRKLDEVQAQQAFETHLSNQSAARVAMLKLSRAIGENDLALTDVLLRVLHRTLNA